MGLVAVAVVSRTASSDRISDGWWQNMVGSVIGTLETMVDGAFWCIVVYGRVATLRYVSSVDGR